MSSLASAADNRDRFESRTFQDGDYKLPYRLLKPKPLQPGQKYPLVIFLHGAGERGEDNEKQLVHGMNDFASDEIMAKYPAFVIAPQCPEGQAWAGISRLAKKPTPDDQLTPALDATLKTVEAVRKEFPIDDKRIYITGLSMGGYGTWEVLGQADRAVCRGCADLRRRRHHDAEQVQSTSRSGPFTGPTIGQCPPIARAR